MPTPYYHDADNGITIYHGDCREILLTLDLSEVAAMVTDPPYGTQLLAGGYGRQQRHTIANDCDTSARDEVLSQWGGPALVFGSPRMPEPPGQWDHRLVWDKCEPGMNGGPWRYTHECIFVRGEGWVRLGGSSFSILRYPTRNGAVGRGVHPHRKPVPLMIALVAAAPAGAIVDPFMGAGSTLRAAKDLGRPAIGIELEERYCEAAVESIAQEVMRPEPEVGARLRQEPFDLGGAA